MAQKGNARLVGASTPEIEYRASLSVKDADVLTIECDLNVQGRWSASGKTLVLSTTSGNVPYTMPDGRVVIIGLNVYTKEPNW